MEIEKPLSEAELDELESFLDSDALSEDALNISSLHGFLTALTVGPSLIPPSEWWPFIWGKEEPIFNSEADGERILGLVMRLYGSIGKTLEKNPDGFLPVLLGDDLENDDYLTSEDWCRGFVQGMAMRPADWDRLVEDPRAPSMLAPILAFTSADAMADVLEHGKGKVKRETLIAFLPFSVAEIYDYWREERRKNARDLTFGSLPIRAAPKVGRNDPCPCGSGKKYKKCCGARA